MIILAVCHAKVVLAEPLKIFILAGQSNMQGHAHVKTLEHIAMDPSMSDLYSKMVGEDGQPLVQKNVWIASLGSSDEEKFGLLTTGYGAAKRGPKIGPELSFGIRMAEQEKGPVLLIKTAWGGKSLHTDFRPPSAGPYVFSEQQLKGFQSRGKDVEEEKSKRAEATGHYYRMMMEYVKKVLDDTKRVCPDYDEKSGYELSGFVWFQGWNDLVDRGVYPKRDKPGGYDQYSEVLGHFIRDIRGKLKAPNLPFVIGVLGVGGDIAARPNRYTPIHLNFRKAMAAPALLPEFKGNVFPVETYKCWDPQLTELKSRESKVKAHEKELKNNKEMKKDEIRTAVEKFRNEIFSEEERKILSIGVSNFEFHYLGSGKIMARIGEAFANALIQGSETKKEN